MCRTILKKLKGPSHETHKEIYFHYWWCDELSRKRSLNVFDLGRHFVRFNNLLTYPDCVLVTSVSRTEYYDWVVLPRKPLLPVTVRVNGVEIPQSALSTSQVATSQTMNIKAAYPGPTDDNPPVVRTGFMIQITNPQYFYKSGDTVDTQYTPAGI